jgi:hypothetical protein
MDRVYRLDNFLESKVARKYTIHVMYLQYNKIEDAFDWEQYVGSLAGGLPDAFCIVDAELLFTERQQLIPVFSAWYRKHQKSFLLFSERYPYAYSLQSFIHHSIYHPLYAEEDVAHFIDFLSTRFAVTLSKNIKTTIHAACGGHLWLVKEIVRYISQSLGSNPMDDPVLHQKVMTIMSGFTKEEYQELLRFSRGLPMTASKEAIHLHALRILELSKKSLLLSSLRNQEPAIVLTQKKDDFFIGSISVTKLFSSSERRVLAFLLTHRDSFVSREEMFAAIWGDTSLDTSNWALDQVMRRLRKKLRDAQVGDSWIKTMKGKGYAIS